MLPKGSSYNSYEKIYSNTLKTVKSRILFKALIRAGGELIQFKQHFICTFFEADQWECGR